MKNNKTLGLIAWGACLVVTNLIMFCVAASYTASFWCTIIFVLIAAVSSLYLQIQSWKPQNRPTERILHISLLSVAIGYMVIQIPVGVVISLASTEIPLRLAILINGVVLVIAWLIGIAALVGNDHIDKVNQRQK